MLRRTPWQPGPAEHTSGPVVVSVTAFSVHRWRDVPVTAFEGLRLRRAWPSLEGAVGMWLWSDLLRRRSGSVSVWESEDDLRRFVRWPVHVAIVRKYRSRGSLAAGLWEADGLDRRAILRDASRWLER